MSKFMIWSRVETHDGNRFTAVATAVPCDSQEHTATEERVQRCESHAAAEAAAQRLAGELFHDIHARGGCVAAAPETRHRSIGY
jgi:pyruvoyl-dependent arginine decarboxylase (PvlArgDC)